MSTPKPTENNQSALDESSKSFICHNPESFQGHVVGDGHCVSFIKLCSNAPNTINWRPGAQVLSLEKLEYGSIIATFKDGIYPNQTGYHAAIYISHDDKGIWVWDQWIGTPVHKRLIRFRNDKAPASNTAQDYSVVRLK